MVMNCTEMQKATEKYASKRVMNNVENIFKRYISEALENCYGSVQCTKHDFKAGKDMDEIGEEEIKYFEALGYTIFHLKASRYSDIKYIITWMPKEEQKFRDEAAKEQIRCQINKAILYGIAIISVVLVFLVLFILPIFLGNVIRILSPAIAAFGLVAMLMYRDEIRFGNRPIHSKYLYISPEK